MCPPSRPGQSRPIAAQACTSQMQDIAYSQSLQLWDENGCLAAGSRLQIVGQRCHQTPHPWAPSSPPKLGDAHRHVCACRNTYSRVIRAQSVPARAPVISRTGSAALQVRGATEGKRGGIEGADARRSAAVPQHPGGPMHRPPHPPGAYLSRLERRRGHQLRRSIA